MSDFKAKMHPIRFQRSPDPLTVYLRGLLLRGGRGRGGDYGAEGGGKGKGKGREGPVKSAKPRARKVASPPPPVKMNKVTGILSLLAAKNVLVQFLALYADIRRGSLERGVERQWVLQYSRKTRAR